MTVIGLVQSARPERSVWSSQEKLTATSVLFQPWAFASGDWVAMISGEVRSMRTVTACGASRFPALSTDQYSTVCSPSVPTVTVLPLVAVAAPSTVNQVASTSERLSLAASSRVTGESTQPPGTPVAEVTGAVAVDPDAAHGGVRRVVRRGRSRRRSAARALPSPVTTVSSGQETTPERLSSQVQWTVTSPSYQPSASGLAEHPGR